MLKHFICMVAYIFWLKIFFVLVILCILVESLHGFYNLREHFSQNSCYYPTSPDKNFYFRMMKLAWHTDFQRIPFSCFINVIVIYVNSEIAKNKISLLSYKNDLDDDFYMIKIMFIFNYPWKSIDNCWDMDVFFYNCWIIGPST